ncbi:hypothetical protein GCM10010517_51840 [Streptosporangium fragile]|uniref:Uncharacterized protein n=1 Tax=Streptosporangium fragile TaxID=46186 RepID=A0ABN3W337_9ACTN
MRPQRRVFERRAPWLPVGTRPGSHELGAGDGGRLRRPGAPTGTLFAALDAASGKVIGSPHRRHRAAEHR